MANYQRADALISPPPTLKDALSLVVVEEVQIIALSLSEDNHQRLIWFLGKLLRGFKGGITVL